MAYRYRQRHLETGDVLDPQDWNENMAEFAEEFNGYLDRDNVPADSVTKLLIKQNAFNKIEFSRDDGSNPVRLDGDVLSFQSTDVTGGATDGNTLPSTTITCDVDELLIVEFSCWWEWYKDNAWADFMYPDPQPSGVYDPKWYEWRPAPAEPFISGTRAEDVGVRFRIVVDGLESFTTGWQSAYNYSDNTYACMATPVSAGRHTVYVEVQLAQLDWDDTTLQEHPMECYDSSNALGFSIRVQARELIVHRRKR